jgi:energy-coupling factor transport system substrate-specific component
VGLLLGLSGQAPGGLGIGLGLIPFLILILVGSFLLGGREQVEAVNEEIAAEGGELRA